MKSLDQVESILDTPAERPFLIFVDLLKGEASENYWHGPSIRVALDDPEAYMDFMRAPGTTILVEDELLD